MDIPGHHFVAARYGPFLWNYFTCISRLHWEAASELVNHTYVGENALLRKLRFFCVVL